MSTPRSLRLCIAAVPVVISGLSDDLFHRLRELMLPFVADDDGGNDDGNDDGPAEARAGGVGIQVYDGRADEGGARWSVHLRSSHICSHTLANDLLRYLEWLAISEGLSATRRYAIFHAAALTHASATVMLLGPSGVGKSTLTLGLMERGWRPLTDDIALVDAATCAVHPFARSFHVDAGWEARHQGSACFDWPGQIPGCVRPREWAGHASPATALFVVERLAQSHSACVPITQAHGVGALLGSATTSGTTRAETVALAIEVAGGAACFHLTNGDLEGALDLICSSSHAPSWP